VPTLQRHAGASARRRGRAASSPRAANCLIRSAVRQAIDRYLARAAFDSQQTRVPVAPDRRDNLMTAVHELHRTRGSFGAEASDQTIVAPGKAARLAPVVAGAVLLFALGLLARGRAMR